MNKKIIYSGVYCIFNLANGKVYIGQAADLGQRYYEHWVNNGINKHHNKLVNRAFKKYGVNNFVFIVLEYIQLLEKLEQDSINLDYHEQYWLDYFQAAKRKYGYNIAEKAGSRRGVQVTDITRKLISINTTGSNNPFYGKSHNPETIAIDREKHSTKRYSSIDPNGKLYYSKNNTQFCKNFNLDRRHMNSVITGKLRAYKKWKISYAPQWMIDKCEQYLTENVYWVEIDGDGNKIENPCFDIPYLPGKEIYLNFPNGRHYFVTNSKKFSVEFNFIPNGIRSLARGEAKSYHGITGYRAPKWLVDKIKPFLKEGQFWVEVDLEGNIING